MASIIAPNRQVMKQLKIFTAQISKYSGNDVIDITVMTGERVFAPTWDMVNMVKNSRYGDLTWNIYTEKYKALMRESYKNNLKIWDKLFYKEELTLACYCPAKEPCHRHLLSDFLVKLGMHLDIAVYKMGERPTNQGQFLLFNL